MTVPPPSTPPGRRTGRARAGALAALLVVLSPACAGFGEVSARGRPDGDGSAGGRSELRTAVAPGSVPTEVGTVPPRPDPLPDPGVAPGECRELVYTPVTAAEPQRGELCRPSGRQRDVAVIVVHGGSGVGGMYQGLRPWARRYLAEGYVTFLPDYHLFVAGSRERPVFPRPEQNLKAAVQYVRGVARAVGIARDRVVVQGHSAGARLGAVALTSPDDPWFSGPELHPGVSCAVDALVAFYHPYDGTMTYADQYFGGGPTSTDPATRQRRERADALARARHASGPALFLTGSRDWDLITTQQAAFAAALRAAGHESRAVVIEGGGHGFDEGDGVHLSRLGERAATEALAFLDDAFPQDPALSPRTPGTRTGRAAPPGR